MRLSVSNIAWDMADDRAVYEMMRQYGFEGLEIAPTRIFPVDPYEKIQEAAVWRNRLFHTYGLSIPSMQSIWYGKKENLFRSAEERKRLSAYSKKAVDFAAAIQCKNLVFGCPHNRNIPSGADIETAVFFFRELGNYAAARGIVFGMEANPPMYGTNFMNDTMSAIRFIEQVRSDGIRLNLDIGTMIQNGECVDELRGQVGLISHVHISEPGLALIRKRELHRKLAQLLQDACYNGFVSIEMGREENLIAVGEAMAYVREVFG